MALIRNQRLLKETWYNLLLEKSLNYTKRIGKMKFPYFGGKNIYIFSFIKRRDQNVHLIHLMTCFSHNPDKKQSDVALSIYIIVNFPFYSLI